MAKVYGWFLTVRQLQNWFVPNKSEEEVLAMQVDEAYAHIRQMRMTAQAEHDRREFERQKAERESKNQNNAGKKKKKPAPKHK